MEVFIGGKKISLAPKDLLDEGGEAKIYLRGDTAIKLYHPQFVTARREAKLKAFPKTIPENLIGPKDLVTNSAGKVIGFTMKAVRGAESFFMLSNKKFRANFSSEKTLQLLLDAAKTLKAIHAVDVVVGDLNDLNIIFADEKALYIDVDSMQFGSFGCEVATEEFLDPRLYGMDFSKGPVFSKESDHYAFAVILFKALLLLNPFGGIHPNYPTLIKRALNQVTVFDPAVRYPKAAIHYSVLPDDLLQYFHTIFAQGKRDAVSEKLLENIRWTTCNGCGQEHARGACPQCALQAPAAIKQVTVVNRKCVADRLFATRGRIIIATVQDEKLKYACEEGGAVKRENGETVLTFNPDNFTRFSIMGSKTLIGRQGKLVIVEKGNVAVETNTGTLGNLSVFESNSVEYVRTQGDLLLKGEQSILGQILENQTWIKLGPNFGFGFYRLGAKTIYFIFDPGGQGINDSIRLPSIQGQLIDAECVFSQTHALFLTATMEQGKKMNAMHLVDARGTVVASRKEEAENSRMLSRIRNKVLGGGRIISATDEGLILIEAQNNDFQEVKLFSDTEPFVNDNVQLLTGNEGIYVISEKEIKLLKLI